MKILHYFKKHDLLFYLFSSLLVIFIGFTPLILHIFHTPKGYFFSLIDALGIWGDYYYISLIRFGMGPDWLLKIPGVFIEHKGSLIQILFVLLGKISLITGISPFLMLSLSKFFSGFLYALSAAFLIKCFLNKYAARLAFIFFLLSQSLPFNTLLDLSKENFHKWVWYFGEASRRISVVPPHYTLGRGLVIFAVFFLFLLIFKKKYSFSIPMVFFLLFGGIIYPPAIFVIAVSLALALALYFISNKFNLRIFTKLEYISLTSFLLACFISMMILKLELNKGFPWNTWQIDELGWNRPEMHFEEEYLHMIGPLIIFAPLAIFEIFKKRKFHYFTYFILIWTFSAFILFPFADFFRLGKFRFTEGAQIVPLAIVSLWSFNFLIDIFKKIAGIKTAFFVRKAIIFIFIANFSFFAFLTNLHFTQLLWPYLPDVYFHPQEVEAYNFLDIFAKRNSIVLAEGYRSTLIPAFARVNPVMTGPTYAAKYYEEITGLRNEAQIGNSILKGSAAKEKAQEYFKLRKIDYVLREKTVGGENYYPDLLDKVFDNSLFEIYKVKK